MCNVIDIDEMISRIVLKEKVRPRIVVGDMTLQGYIHSDVRH